MKRKQVFSKRVIGRTAKVNVIDISELVRNDEKILKEVNKVLNMANQRIRRIESEGLASPAVKSVLASRGFADRFFSIREYNPTDDFELIKKEYGEALSFLRNPTSSSEGARQYIEWNARELHGIPFESANKIIDIATEPYINQWGDVNLFNYAGLLEKFRSDVLKYGNEIEAESKLSERQLEALLEIRAKEIASSGEYLRQIDKLYRK